jgi:hypothetical protein
MLNKSIRYSIIIFGVLFLFSTCGKDDASVNASRLRIKLTDATSLVIKELYFNINEIEVFVIDSANTEGEWVPLEYSGGEYNLLQLRNGKMVQLVDQYFPAGKVIQKIKLILGNNNRLISTTAVTEPLNLPAEILEGIIIDNVNAELNANIISSIVIDVNVALSVRESNGNYFLDPAARAFPETFGGSLRGYVAPIEADPFIAIVQETDTFITIPEADGMFLFSGLNEGPWEVHIVANPLTNFRDTVFSDTVVQGRIKEITPKPVRLKPM